MEVLAGGLRKVDEEVGALGGGKVEAGEFNWRGKQSLIGAYLVKGLVIGEGQGEEAAIGGVEKTEAVGARLHFEVGPYFAVDQDEASEELGDPGVLGIAGIRIEKLTIGGELAVGEYERDLVFAGAGRCRRGIVLGRTSLPVGRRLWTDSFRRADGRRCVLRGRHGRSRGGSGRWGGSAGWGESSPTLWIGDGRRGHR